MPTYDYLCPQCGPFEALRRLADRDVPAPCPACKALSARAWLSAPMLADMPAERRQAMATNERAQHEPKRSGSYGRMHPAGCSCCSSSRRGATVRAPDGSKAFPTRRPWMISH